MLSVALLALTAACGVTEPEGRLVHVIGTGPRTMERVSLYAADAEGAVNLGSWEIDPADPGRFDFTTHVHPDNCALLQVHGTWCRCGLLGDGVVHSTESVALGSCGEHTVVLLE